MNAHSLDESTKLPNSVLAWQLIRDYLKQKGYRLETLHELSPDLQKELMISANMHASLKLAEIESFSKLRRKIHIKV